MIRKTLNKIFSSRVFYMVFSLLVAAALWMYVEINEYQEQSFPVNNVPVVLKNEDMLRDRGLLISSTDPQNVSLTFECPRSVAARLTVPPLHVVVDLANVTTTGATSINHMIVYPENVDQRLISHISPSVERISLIVDRLTHVQVPVTVDYRGGAAAEDLVVEEEQFVPQVITVSGPREVVSTIKEAFVPIPRENLASTFAENLEFVLLDENGEELDDETLALVTTEVETIHVTIPVRQQKDVPLTVALVHGAGSTELNTNIICVPAYVTVVGEPEAIREINSITLGTVNTTRFRDTLTETYRVVVPDHLTNLRGVTEAIVTVEVLGLDFKFFSTSNLHTENTPPGYRSEIWSQSLDIWLRGKREDLDEISSEDIRVVADLTDREPGTSRVPARIVIDGTNADVGAVGADYRIAVTIIRDTS